MNEADIAKQKDMPHGDDAKVLFFDLEIAPMVAYTYEAYEANALKILQPKQIISFAWMWDTEKTPHCMAVQDYPGYKPGVLKLDDKELCKDLYDILEQADILIGHNIRKFDIPEANTRFLTHGFKPTKKWNTKNTIDTLRDTKKEFHFAKNNLDYLSEQLGGGTKTDRKHSDLIWGFLDGNKQHVKHMKAYNKQDVLINREYYHKVKGWLNTNVNLSFWNRVERACPRCGSKELSARGNQVYRTGLRKVFACKECGRRFPYGDIIKSDTIRSFNP